MSVKRTTKVVVVFFLPAVGWRNDTGALGRQGDWGSYWASTQSGNTTGYTLYFNDASSAPAHPTARKYDGATISCVR